MPDLYEISVEVDGVLTDAEGNRLDREGKPITEQAPAAEPDESEEP